MVERLGWEWVFFMNVPLGVFAVWRGRSVLTESSATATRGIPDPTGIALLVVGMAAIAAAVVKGEDWGYADVRTLASACGGLLALFLFIARSRSIANPAIDLRLFDDTRFMFANAATFVYGIAFVVMFFGNIFFLTQQWHYTLQEAGLAITPGPMTVIPFAMLAGRIADKHGHRPLLLAGSALFTLGGIWYATTVGSEPDFWGVWLPRAVLTGAAVGLVLPSLSGAAVANIPRQDSAVGSAINQATRQFGSVIGVAIAVALLGQQHGATSPEAFTQRVLVDGRGRAAHRPAVPATVAPRARCASSNDLAAGRYLVSHHERLFDLESLREMARCQAARLLELDLDLRVGSARNELPVEQVEDLLVLRHLALDIEAVEIRARRRGAQRLERRYILVSDFGRGCALLGDRSPRA